MTKQDGSTGFAPPAPPLLIPSGYVSLREAVELASAGIDPEAPWVGGCSAPEDRLRRLLHDGRVSAQVQFHENGICFSFPAQEWAGPRAPMFFEDEGEVFLPADAEMLTGDWAFVRIHRAQLISALQSRPEEQIDAHKAEDIFRSSENLKETHPKNDSANNLNHALPLTRTTSGRKPTYDWPAIKNFVIELLEYHGLPSSEDPELPNQAAIERKIMEHCQQQYGREPAASNIRQKLAKWLKEFKKKKSEIDF